MMYNVVILLPSLKVTESLSRYLQFRLIVTLLSIIFFSYPSVTGTLLSFFNCPLVRSA